MWQSSFTLPHTHQNTSNSGSGVRDSSLARRVVSSEKGLYSTLFLFTQVYTGDILLGGNPAMDWHPVQGGEAILLGMLRAKETGISSGHYWAFGSGALLPLPNTARNGSWLAEYLLQPIRSTILSCVANVISMECWHSFLWSHFAGNQPVASQNVDCFLRLIRECGLLHLCHRDYFESCLISFFIF